MANVNPNFLLLKAITHKNKKRRNNQLIFFDSYFHSKQRKEENQTNFISGQKSEQKIHIQQKMLKKEESRETRKVEILQELNIFFSIVNIYKLRENRQFGGSTP